MPINTYRSWKQKHSDIGCVFARYMAGTPQKFGQRAVLLRGNDPARIAEGIARRIARYVNDPKVNTAALVMPDVKTLLTLVKVAQELSSKEDWRVSRRILKDTPAGDVVAFNIVRDIPFNNATCPSEALVLGPFDVFPRTRRSPVTALEIFVGVPPEKQHDGSPTTRAHLADVPIQLPIEGLFDSMWEASQAAPKFTWRDIGRTRQG